MNLHKKCRKCREFFPAKPMELKFFCDKEECQKYLTEYHFYTIKSNRYIPMDYFDIYDFDRPIIKDDGKVFGVYERVCRQCGEPLFNKDGKYSVHRRYCAKHTGYELWVKYNWGIVSKDYVRKVSDENKELISKNVMEFVQAHPFFYENNPQRIERDITNLTVCEECGKLCQITDTYWDRYNNRDHSVINVHHIFPVHKITMKNIHLIWDYSNLKALCKDCHRQQDHQLKTKVDPFIHFRKITEFLGGV